MVYVSITYDGLVFPEKPQVAYQALEESKHAGHLSYDSVLVYNQNLPDTALYLLDTVLVY